VNKQCEEHGHSVNKQCEEHGHSVNKQCEEHGHSVNKQCEEHGHSVNKQCEEHGRGCGLLRATRPRVIRPGLTPTLSDQLPLCVCLCALCILTVCEEVLSKLNSPHALTHDIQHTTYTNPYNTRHDQNNTTNDHTKNYYPALNTDQRWRDDGA